jgi:DNA-directed DNA polymerase III PolC
MINEKERKVVMRYKKPFVEGVKLPEIHLENKELEELGLNPDASSVDILRSLCRKGVKERGVDKKEKSERDVYYSRVKTEIEILDRLGFVDYALLNWDIIKFCKRKDIPTGFGRGSAAGCLVLYLLGVTNVDPIKHDLYFERFVSESRSKKVGDGLLDGSLLADVDNDICYHRRSDVLSYIEDQNEGKTSKILTLSTLSSKVCVKECCKIAGFMTEGQAARISDFIPKKYGKNAKISEAYEDCKELKEFFKSPSGKKIYKIARKIEGLVKGTGVHPSGVAICSDNQASLMPVQRTKDRKLVSGYDMDDVAALCVKFDILGIKNLSVVDDVCKQVGIKKEDIDIDDESIYKFYQNFEDSAGIFQIEAPTAGKVCYNVKPRNIEQLSAVLSVARPGAIEFQDDYIRYVETGEFQSVHEYFDDILGYTGGIPLYQEQLMKMAVKVGFSLDEAEQLRRIVGKKKVDKMKSWKSKIEDKVKEKNLDPEVAQVLWSVAEDSANYSFNKSHAMSYAYLSAVQTYLKQNYPKEMFWAMLNFAHNNDDELQVISSVERELSLPKYSSPSCNISLLPPDFNLSEQEHTLEEGGIRYGFKSIKGVATKAFDALIKFRGGESFKNKYEAFISAKDSGLDVGTLSALIQAGLFDSLFEGGSLKRCRLVYELRVFNNLTPREQNHFALMEGDLLDNLEKANPNKDNPMLDEKGRLMIKETRWGTIQKKIRNYTLIYENNKKRESFTNWFCERKVLGYSATKKIKDAVDKRLPILSTLDVKDESHGSKIMFVGVVTQINHDAVSRAGNTYSGWQIADEMGVLETMMMGDKLTKWKRKDMPQPKVGEVVIINGTLARSDRGTTVFLDNIKSLDEHVWMQPKHIDKSLLETKEEQE